MAAKSVPAAKGKKPPPPARAEGSEQSSPSLPKESGFSVGDNVSQPKFGNGIVKKIDGDKLTIEFAGKVTKQIVDYYVTRNSDRSHEARRRSRKPLTGRPERRPSYGYRMRGMHPHVHAPGIIRL